jgi:hypothetical protein
MTATPDRDQPKAPPAIAAGQPSGWIADLDALSALYPDPPARAAVVKVSSRLTPAQAIFLNRARFAVLITVGPEGTDGSPRGDDGPVVRIADPGTLWLPDWRGNNRLDSLRNIVRDGRVSLMAMVPGSGNVLRVNGTARLTADPAVTAAFARDGATPRSVIVIRVAEVYAQCARAILRAGLWTRGDDSQGLPTAGELIASAAPDFDPVPYDTAWPARAAGTMW